MDFGDKVALVTGANSGLGFEAAAQLAEAGYGTVILACRSLEKAEKARAQLSERCGRNPFEVVAVDVSSFASSEAAAAELIQRYDTIDALLLNAGMVSGDEMKKTDDGLEIAFASSIVGHHILTLRLLKAGTLAQGARVVLAGSEAARGDLPGMMDMKLYDFVTGQPSLFGDELEPAMFAFARGQRPAAFNPTRHYAATKAFSSWWAAALARRAGDRLAVFTVSPGANMATNAARHTRGFKNFLFTKIMPTVGTVMGMNQPVPKGAKRYVDVINDEGGAYVNGGTYTSKEKKLIGPLFRMTCPHLIDEDRQEAAWNVICELTGVAA